MAPAADWPIQGGIGMVTFPGYRAGCLTCQATAGETAAPGGVIYADAFWILEHSLPPIRRAGWLVLKPRRHCEAFPELTAAEATWFSPLLYRATTAMTHVLRPEKIYVCLFADSAEYAHIFFHLVPRYSSDPESARGPQLLTMLREQAPKASTHEAARVAAAIRAEM